MPSTSTSNRPERLSICSCTALLALTSSRGLVDAPVEVYGYW